LQLGYRWIKGADEALAPDFVQPLAQLFGLNAFVETGTYRGDTIAAMRPLFRRLASVELSNEFARRAAERFAADHAVDIIHADSTAGLARAFAAIGETSAFVWLDAHYSGGPTARGADNTPILGELDCLFETRAGRDVVLIDDARLFWPVPGGFLDHDTLHGYPMLSRIAELLRGSKHGYEVHCFGDALLAVPPGISATPVLQACTLSRLAPPGAARQPGLEAVITSSAGAERDCLSDPPPFVEAQKAYGLGGHYFYWRALLREREGRHAEAAEDLAFARRCQVIAPED
jgi:hypothetical protein